MNVTEAVRRRMSVRGFKPDPVPEALIREILTEAQRAPSGGNLQPWRVHVITGEPLTQLAADGQAAMMGRTDGGEYVIYPENLWEPLNTRRFQVGEDLYATLNIPREDKAGRIGWFLPRNLSFFGAPVAMFFTFDKRVGPPQWSDCGMFMQTIMLLAVERGLDTCAQEFWGTLPKTVRKAFDLPETEMVFSGMALGYRDEADPVNTLRTRRAPLDEVATFKGF